MKSAPCTPHSLPRWSELNVNYQWNVWGLGLLGLHLCPVNALKPSMVLYFLDRLVSDSLVGVPHQHHVDQVSGIWRPSERQLVYPNAHLFGKDLVTNLLPILSIVWPFSQHEFIPDDANCEDICHARMVFSAHNLRGHVAWGARRILIVLLSELPRYSQIGYPDIPV